MSRWSSATRMRGAVDEAGIAQRCRGSGVGGQGRAAGPWRALPFRPQGVHRIHARGRLSRDEARERSHTDQEPGDRRECRQVRGRHIVEQRSGGRTCTRITIVLQSHHMNAYLTLRLPADLARALARWARMRRLPKSTIVREAVARYLAPPSEGSAARVTGRELAARWATLPHL